jgi:predicted O-methyltransferase YrrM
MGADMPTYNDALEAYLRHHFGREDDALSKIRAQIPVRGLPAITVKPEEGAFLQFLAAISNARNALEIGTLGGYSGTWIARGLVDGGRLITLEVEDKHAQVAQEHFKLAGVADKVEIKVGNAHDLLPTLIDEGPFDFVFIDAEKEGYLAYLDWALQNLAPGGVVAAHNAFRHGDIVNSTNQEERTKVMRVFNQRLADDPRLISTIFPAGDGMAVAVFMP